MGRRKGRPVDGWLIVDKPVGVTSTAVVARARWLLNAAKCGHAGTLDPLATGVLPLAFGEATKVLPFLVDRTKSYRFTVRFGFETTTADQEGTATRTSPVIPDAPALTAVLPGFRGAITQVPPAFSAIKVDGGRAYDLARAGVEVTLAARPVTIHAADLIAVDGETATFDVTCSKGTYVRSLAVDIARAVGAAGHVVELRRTRVGPFGLDHAISLDMGDGSRDGRGPREDELTLVLSNRIVPLATALDDIPALALDGTAVRQLRSGQSVRDPEAPHRGGGEGAWAAGAALATTGTGTPVAMVQRASGLLVPVRVFNIAD
jgi:tRNA pseudouridine55 synthase